MKKKSDFAKNLRKFKNKWCTREKFLSRRLLNFKFSYAMLFL